MNSASVVLEDKDVAHQPKSAINSHILETDQQPLPEGSAYVLDHAAERALCRKFDVRLLPLLAVMYLCNTLDKGNLGNAKTNNLEKNLNLTGNQYNIILSVFYVPFVLGAPPIAMIGKKYGPAIVLPALMACFGILTLLLVAATNFSGMVALRWFIGLTESAFFALLVYYLTTFYRRSELGRRLAITYAAGNMANAFSGLLAFAIFRIKNHRFYSWRYLFLIEGLLTFGLAIIAYLNLPFDVTSARFLNEEEKKLAYHRLQTDSSSTVNEPFNLKEAVRIFNQPTTYVFLAIEMCLGVPLQSASLFLPQIVARLGYSTVKTNLFTVAPNICGAVVLLILAFSSDFTRCRSIFIIIGFALAFVGFTIHATIDVVTHTRIAYFATFLICSGVSVPSALLSTWYNNNVPHEGRRVMLTSVGVPLANLMGLVSSNIFSPQTAPKYRPALVTTAAFGGTGALITASLALFMTLDNRKRNKKFGRKLTTGDVSTELLQEGPGVAEFRWFL
ncbi:BgTH12-01150 [Blumeria graminis f. sp. triticale]|uniref:Bgt-2067 n=3 Tax=Blumeria graminis TaxID=34373 RepID=A0A061HRZ3_BLUGR|nr:High affinity nicotinic acid plasma membrane permease [Blumeria graminis f. sp. tritici 96224]CAD6505660.1 BgTH12-01150 [Blumeria graminis f. sp. triticale]VDB93813.1 Bgt-2067 [Blumeria graminis f. sp. tritici]